MHRRLAVLAEDSTVATPSSTSSPTAGASSSAPPSTAAPAVEPEVSSPSSEPAPSAPEASDPPPSQPAATDPPVEVVQPLPDVSVEDVSAGTQDDLGMAQDFVVTHSLTFPVLWDPGFDSWRELGVPGQPYVVLIDGQGRRAGSMVGWHPRGGRPRSGPTSRTVV